MTEVRFHREIYPAEAVDGAVKVFEKYGTLEVSDDATHRVVRVSAKNPTREKKLALELTNYALGLTRRETVVS